MSSSGHGGLPGRRRIQHGPKPPAPDSADPATGPEITALSPNSVHAFVHAPFLSFPCSVPYNINRSPRQNLPGCVHFNQPSRQAASPRPVPSFSSSLQTLTTSSMSDIYNKESLRPRSMAGSETTTVANSTVPSVMEQKEQAVSAAPSAASVRDRDAVDEESTEKTPHVEGSGSVSDDEDDFVYPKGWQLTIITTALAFSVFCMALVRNPQMPTFDVPEANDLDRTTLFSLLPFPALPISLKPSTTWDGTDHRTCSQPAQLNSSTAKSTPSIQSNGSISPLSSSSKSAPSSAVLRQTPPP